MFSILEALECFTKLESNFILEGRSSDSLTKRSPGIADALDTFTKLRDDGMLDAWWNMLTRNAVICDSLVIDEKDLRSASGKRTKNAFSCFPFIVSKCMDLRFDLGIIKRKKRLARLEGILYDVKGK